MVTLSLDQGPFLMNIAGEVEPLLPTLFDETFDPENYWPPLEVFEQTSASFFILSHGTVGYEENGRYSTRAVFAEGEPFIQ